MAGAGYDLGIDLGTTFTAAGIRRRARSVEVVQLGIQRAEIPTVVFLTEDDQFLVGEPAARRGQAEPARLAREFKRRLGDAAPLLLGGTPVSPEELTAQVVRHVVRHVMEHEGAPPDRVVVAHPSNWGPYKREVLNHAIRLADLDASGIPEATAAAVHYAHDGRIEVGDTVLVYDLGGGTFDAAVLERTSTGFEVRGTPEGIDRLGGIDIDDAVFSFVDQHLGGVIGAQDVDDPATARALLRLREDCRAAKEALSADSRTTIPVQLPGLHTAVALTRNELEHLVRPTLRATVGAVRRAMSSAVVTPSDLASVVLVGGTSRMPMVHELIAGELGRPVRTDPNPKYAVALGAAWEAASAKKTEPIAASETLLVAPDAGSSSSGMEPVDREPADSAADQQREVPRASSRHQVSLSIDRGSPAPSADRGPDDVGLPADVAHAATPQAPSSPPTLDAVAREPERLSAKSHRRSRRAIAVVAPVLALLVAIAVARSSDGDGDGEVSSEPIAAVINGTEISEQALVNELEAIRGNAAYVEAYDAAAAEAGGPLILGGGEDLDPAFVASTLSTRILFTLVGTEVDARGLDIDDECRAQAADKTSERVAGASPEGDGDAILVAFGEEYSSYLIDREADLLALTADLSNQACVDPDAVRRYFDEHENQFETACVSHILVATDAEADEIRAQLDDGADFATLASADSIDTDSASQGGSLGCTPEGAFVPEFDAVAFAQPIGVVSDPVQTEFGYHLILVTERGAATFEQVEQQVAEAMASELDSAFGDWFRQAVADADVTVDESYGIWDSGEATILQPPTGDGADAGDETSTTAVVSSG